MLAAFPQFPTCLLVVGSSRLLVQLLTGQAARGAAAEDGGRASDSGVPPPASRLRSKPVFFIHAQGQDLVLKTTLVRAVGQISR